MTDFNEENVLPPPKKKQTKKTHIQSMRLQSETLEQCYSIGILINYNTEDAMKQLQRCNVFEIERELQQIHSFPSEEPQIVYDIIQNKI